MTCFHYRLTTIKHFSGFLLITIFLSACGGGDNDDVNDGLTEQEAIDKIVAFAGDSNEPIPTLQNYLDAGVTGLTVENVEQLNGMVDSLDGVDVDTTAELNSLAAQLNAPPTADAGTDKTVSTNESITLTGVGTDTDGTISSYQWTVGTTVLANTASFSYMPSVVGTDTLTLSVTDNDGATVTDTVNIIVVAATPNHAPTVENITASTTEDSTINITLMGSDADGDNLYFTKETDPAHGTVTFNSGIASYTPNTNYSGPDGFTYSVNDGNIASDSATVTITVSAVNDAPIANEVITNTLQNTVKNITLNAIDIDGDSLSYSVVDNPAHGNVTISDNIANYTPANNYSGLDSFSYIVNDGTTDSNVVTVSIKVDFVNTAPIANDISVLGNEDTTIGIELTGTDIDGDTLTSTKVTNPAHGIVRIVGNVATYTPIANYNGPDSFTYRVYDNTVFSNLATVSITVYAINDVPVANSATVNTDEDISKTITLNAEDVDGDSLSYIKVTDPAHGNVSFSGNSVVYTPSANYFGSDEFTYKVDDGVFNSNTATIIINVASINDVPVANDITTNTLEDTAKAITLLATDADGDALTYTKLTDPANGTVSFAGNVATYTPDLNYNSAPNNGDSFTYKVNDGTVDSNIATVTINVGEVNDAPVALDGTAVTNEDTATAITLSASDVDGDTLTFNANVGPANGTVSFAGNIATYTPNANYNGSDSFTYTANDSTVDSNIATVNITVNSVNDDPVANDTTAITDEDTAKAITLTASDIDGDPLTYSVDIGPINGTVSFVANIVTYTPALNYNGTDSFTYKVNDGTVNSASATVGLTVNAVNDAPTANAGLDVSVVEGQTVILNGSATDPDTGDTLSYSWSPAANLSNAIIAQPTFTAPAVTADTPQTLTLTVTDAGGLTGTDTATITVLNLPAQPQNVVATAGIGEVTITWTNVTGVSYDLCLATQAITTPSNCAALAGGALNLNQTSPATITGLMNDTKYHFVLIPSNTNGVGVVSAEVIATPANFTKLDATGTPLVDQAANYATTPWDCVKNNATGNIWEVKSSTGLHNTLDKYTWYNTDPATNGGADGFARQTDSGVAFANDNTCSGYVAGTPSTYCNTQDFVTRVNAIGWCGSSNWRLPTLAELHTNTPLTNPAYFPNAQLLDYWSSTPVASDSNSAWSLYFTTGVDSADLKSSNEFIRLVR